MQMKHILGTVTIIAIVGGTIYAIKKSKDLEKTEGEAISLEEARAEVEMRRRATAVREEDSYEEFEEMVDEIREVAEHNRSFMPYDDDEEDEYDGIDENIEGPSIDINEDTYNSSSKIPLSENRTEEDNELRYDPNSNEARSQYIKMELAEWAPLEDTYQTMLKLFDFPFIPQNDGDHDLKTVIIDYRVQFFGFGSRWTQEITYADVILHYARATQFNCDETIRYWVEYFLDFSEFNIDTTSHQIDGIIKNLNNHTYFNEERQTFGLFGLTRSSMDQAIKIANRNIDRSVTYEIEFNEFLKSCI